MTDEMVEHVAAAREGDRAAFERLVRATEPATYSLALRLTGNEEDARDVLQDTYLRAFRGLARFRGDAQFTTWLYRITVNCATNQLGKRTKHRHDLLEEDFSVADDRREIDPADRADLGFLRQEVAGALMQLPYKLRSVVVMRDIYDLPHEAIAAELGISETAAKVRLHRARKMLREKVLPLPYEERAHAV